MKFFELLSEEKTIIFKLSKQDEDRKNYDVIYDNKIVGYFDVLCNDVLSGNKKEIYIQTEKEYRGQGFAKLILEAAKKKFGLFYSVIANDNVKSLNLHNSMGFKKINDIGFIDEKDKKKFVVYSSE